jgi:hypothetical protein
MSIDDELDALHVPWTSCWTASWTPTPNCGQPSGPPTRPPPTPPRPRTRPTCTNSAAGWPWRGGDQSVLVDDPADDA